MWLLKQEHELLHAVINEELERVLEYPGSSNLKTYQSWLCDLNHARCVAVSSEDFDRLLVLFEHPVELTPCSVFTTEIVVAMKQVKSLKHRILGAVTQYNELFLLFPSMSAVDFETVIQTIADRTGLRLDSEIYDVTPGMNPLALGGKSGFHVIQDYLSFNLKDTSGSFCLVTNLDNIPVVLICIQNELLEGIYIVLAQNETASILWRSFLSFLEVSPVPPAVFESYFKQL